MESLVPEGEVSGPLMGAEHPLKVPSGRNGTGGPPAGGAWGAD